MNVTHTGGSLRQSITCEIRRIQKKGGENPRRRCDPPGEHRSPLVAYTLPPK